jgi:putative transposase
VVLHKGFRYRIYPTPEQERRLLAWQGPLRFLWNLALEQYHLCMDKPRCERHYPSTFDQSNELTGLRAELPWLAEVPQEVSARLLVELHLAWQRCFKKLADEPRFKKKGRDWAPICEPNPKAFHLRGDGLIFPKLGGPLRIKMHRPLEGTPKTCTITRDVDQWFASISCEVEVKNHETPKGAPVALDRGVVNLLADSNGHFEPNPCWLKHQQQRITHAQRVLAGRQKGSRNRQKAKLKLAHLHRKVRRQRNHLLHKISLHYAQSHSMVVVEKLQVRNMTKSAKGTADHPGKHVRAKSALNRSIMDVGWGILENFLRYKTVWYGSRLVEVAAAYSSRTCSRCGHVDPRSRRSQSEFVCVSCGHREHADTNAAKVLLNRGTHGGAVCGGYGEVSRPERQELRVARRGTRHVWSAPKAPAFRPG